MTSHEAATRTTAAVPAASPPRGRTLTRGALAALGLMALALTGCSTGAEANTSSSRPTTPQKSSTPPGPSPTPTPAPTPSPSLDSSITPISDAQWSRMVAAGLWRKGCPEIRSQLRRVEMNYWGFDGKVHRGVLVVNQDITGSIARIFTGLLEKRFPIRRMQPMEDYDGDLNASLKDDNTSAYNCRRANQINAPFMESPHANGRAIDINPYENPWKDLRSKQWSPSSEFAARTPGKGKINKGGLVWQAFIDEGWVWQDIKVADYMHFDTGYPSAPFTGRPSVSPTPPSGTPSPSVTG